jgi:hypothetical protein
MRRANLSRADQVSDAARQLENPVIRPRRKLHLVHRRAHQAVASLIELTVLPDLSRAHIGVAGNPIG